MNSRLGGLPGRAHFLHSRSMYDLSRQTIPPSRTCVSATYHPAYAYPTRPVSFCPTSAPEPVPFSSNRRLSELPAQLDLGFPFGSLLEGDSFSFTKGHSPDRHSERKLFPNLSRLSHRCGTSSGSGPSERAIISVENSSFTSSVCTAPTSPIDSDRASSIYECAALDFPEPPPIGSPVIRRMRSSPWFLSADEVDGVLAIPARGGVTLDRLRRQSRVPLTGPSIRPYNFEYPNENTLEFYDGHIAGRIDKSDACEEGALLDGHVKYTQSEKYLRQHNLQVRSREEGDNPKAMPRTELSSTSFGRLPKIIRKMASMRSESHRTQESADVTNGSTVTFQRPIPRIRSFRPILLDPEDDELPRTNFKQDYRQLNKQNFFWTKPKPELDAEKDRQRRQSTSHMVYESNLPGKSSTTLGPSFRHGTSWKKDVNKSFIDISPDRKARPKGRGKERMKSLLSKANGLFSWGRSHKKAPLSQGGRQNQILEAK